MSRRLVSVQVLMAVLGQFVMNATVVSGSLTFVDAIQQVRCKTGYMYSSGGQPEEHVTAEDIRPDPPQGLGDANLDVSLSDIGVSSSASLDSIFMEDRFMVFGSAEVTATWSAAPAEDAYDVHGVGDSRFSVTFATDPLPAYLHIDALLSVGMGGLDWYAENTRVSMVVFDVAGGDRVRIWEAEMDGADAETSRVLEDGLWLEGDGRYTIEALAMSNALAVPQWGSSRTASFSITATIAPCDLHVADPIWANESDEMVLPYDGVELEFVFQNKADTDVSGIDVTFQGNRFSQYGAAVTFEDPDSRIDHIPANGRKKVTKAILIAGLDDKDTPTHEIWQKVVKGGQTLSLEDAIKVDIAGVKEPFILSPRKTEDGEILSIQYPDLSELAGTPIPKDDGDDYYKRGDSDFHHPNDPLVRKYALEAGLWGSDTFPDTVAEVVSDVYSYINGLLSSHCPDERYNDEDITRRINSGNSDELRPGEARGAEICITQAQLFGSFARTLGIPSRELNMGLVTSIRHEPPHTFEWACYQEAAIQVWYAGDWHLYDTFADKTSLDQYVEKGSKWFMCNPCYSYDPRHYPVEWPGPLRYDHDFGLGEDGYPIASLGWRLLGKPRVQEGTIFVLGSPVRSYLADDQGRVTGYVNGSVREGIPNSYYLAPGSRVWRDKSDPEAFSETDETIFVGQDGQPGDYSLAISGTNDGHYDLTLAYVRPDGEIDGSTITSDIHEGETHTYEVSVSAGGEISATPAGAIEAQLWIVPPLVHRQQGRSRIGVVLRLPEGITKDQVNMDRSLVLYPGGIQGTDQSTIQWRRRKAVYTSIIAFFDKADLMAAVPKDGATQVDVFGQLVTGRFFSGSDTLRIFSGSWRGDDSFEWDFDAFR